MSGTGTPKVAICTVIYNSADDLPQFLASLTELDYPHLEVILLDNASHDGSAEVARAHQPAVPFTRVIDAGENLGFAGGMNRAIRETDASFILALNADARPRPDFVRQLVERARNTPRTGAVTSRLVRPATGTESATLDACGMHLTLTWRHFDRGSNAPDEGQYSEAEFVFGGTGAATLYRREALEDVAVSGEHFLEEFHSFREDAELSFRFAERGWRVVYDPSARAEHRRHNLPERRRQMSQMINMHSLKNRYLIRAYHLDRANGLLTFIPAVARDLAIFGYVLLRERSSLAAYSWLWKNRKMIRNRRSQILAQRTRPARELAAWFVRERQPL